MEREVECGEGNGQNSSRMGTVTQAKYCQGFASSIIWCEESDPVDEFAVVERARQRFFVY
jgi:hypothetical protein